MRGTRRKLQFCALALAICAVAALSPFGRALARDLELQAGVILKLSIDNYLTSRSSKVGDPFTATVSEDVRSYDQVAVPRGSKVRGRVSSVVPAQRPSKSGTISIDFDELVLNDGRSFKIEGQLTSLDAAEKRQIDEEGRVEGGSSTKRNVVFIGGGAAGGAVIGAIAGGGKGAGIGAIIGAGAGVLGSVFSKGEEAEVQSGTRFGMEILRPVRITDANSRFDERGDRDRIENRDRGNDRANNDRGDDRYSDRRDDRGRVDPARPRRSPADLGSRDLVRSAQASLRDLNYYKGPVNGFPSVPTRTAMKTFQRDKNLRQTGVLDFDTALALGIVDNNGVAVLPVKVTKAEAVKASDGSVRVRAEVETNTGGWDVFADPQITGDTLKVVVRGTPPEGASTQALTRYPVEVTVPRAAAVTKVVVRGDGDPINLDLAGPRVEVARRASLQATALFESYGNSLGVIRRSGGGSADLSNIDRLTENQVQVLAALNGLKTSAQFMEQLAVARATDAGLRGAAIQLIRDSRQAGRLLNRLNELNKIDRDWRSFDSTMRELADSYKIAPDNDRD